MDKDIFEGKWTQIKGKLRETWGDMTDDELEEAKGNREQLAGKIQEKYGESKDDVRKKVDEILDNA